MQYIISKVVFSDFITKYVPYRGNLAKRKTLDSLDKSETESEDRLLNQTINLLITERKNDGVEHGNLLAMAHLYDLVLYALNACGVLQYTRAILYQ